MLDAAKQDIPVAYSSVLRDFNTSIENTYQLYQTERRFWGLLVLMTLGLLGAILLSVSSVLGDLSLIQAGTSSALGGVLIISVIPVIFLRSRMMQFHHALYWLCCLHTCVLGGVAAVCSADAMHGSQPPTLEAFSIISGLVILLPLLAKAFVDPPVWLTAGIIITLNCIFASSPHIDSNAFVTGGCLSLTCVAGVLLMDASTRLMFLSTSKVLSLENDRGNLREQVTCLDKHLAQEHEAAALAKNVLEECKSSNHSKDLEIEEQMLHIKEQAQRTEEVLLSKQQAERTAFATINHAAKRTMLNSIFWLEKIQTKLIPMFRTKMQTTTTELEKITQELFNENSEGVELCKCVLLQQQIAAGTYRLTEVPVNLQELLLSEYGVKGAKVFVEPEVPEYVWMDLFLFKLAFGNAFSNARAHGRKDGEISIWATVKEVLTNTPDLAVSPANSRHSICISLMNEPGETHEQNVSLQTERGLNYLFEMSATNVQLANQIGSESSTFLGLCEIVTVSKVMNAKPTLYFEPKSVKFKLGLDLRRAESVNATLELPPGMVLICADDDAASRASYKGLMKQPGLNFNMELCKVYGATYAEAKAVFGAVMEMSAAFDCYNIICILDQHMDRYKEGSILGTDIVKELRKANFKSFIFVRSANDDFDSVELYRKAGATGNLTKDCNVKQLAQDLKTQCFNAMRGNTLSDVPNATITKWKRRLLEGRCHSECPNPNTDRPARFSMLLPSPGSPTQPGQPSPLFLEEGSPTQPGQPSPLLLEEDIAADTVHTHTGFSQLCNDQISTQYSNWGLSGLCDADQEATKTPACKIPPTQ